MSFYSIFLSLMAGFYTISVSVLYNKKMAFLRAIAILYIMKSFLLFLEKQFKAIDSWQHCVVVLMSFLSDSVV